MTEPTCADLLATMPHALVEEDPRSAGSGDPSSAPASTRPLLGTFWTRVDVDAAALPLTEGQAVRFHTLGQIRLLRLGYEDNAVLEDFFARRNRT